jgi:hypothetical protein
LLFPPLRSAWARRGQPAPVLISGANARRSIFGALHLRTGRMLCLAQERKRAQDFQEFLDLIHWHYRGWDVALLLDEHSSHTAEASQSLAEDLNIRRLWLPVRSPHLNPLDQLWGHGKRAVCANRQQASIEDQVIYFLAYYEGLTPQERLIRAGLHSPEFWLYQVSH